MAVNEYTYGTVAGVERNIGWVVENRKFTTNTTPTLGQVEQQLDDIAAEIHAEMYKYGYQVDTAAAVLSAAPRAEKWLSALNEAGASARILEMFPIANDSESQEKNPESYWQRVYDKGKALIATKFLEQAGLTISLEQSDRLVCTSVLDEDGNEKKPLFKRGMWG